MRSIVLLCAALICAASAAPVFASATASANPSGNSDAPPVATANAKPTVNPADDPRYQPKPYVNVRNPEWAKNAVLYQINLRQFTPEGTLRAAQRELPRLKRLGVDVLWLMPIHPIGAKNRKGTLGSPYSVRDYYGVNPEFGDFDDLKAFVDDAHAQGMRVILDWVANHTAWDNPLLQQHPEWYARDWKGDFHPTPWWDWSDIINLDYSQPGLRRYMTEAMKYWVREAGVDGYRCDVAGFVPLDFWDNLRSELDAIKPVFMLAEWESRDLHARAFDATYAWSWYDSLHRIAKGHADVNAMYVYYSWNEAFFPRGGMRMTFVSNHDKNAWEGTEFEAFGDGVKAAMVLSFVSEGIPMLYNGQEAGNTKRLAFFEKDPIVWREHPHGALYADLIRLKKNTTALWNGRWGASMIHVPNDRAAQVLSFVRRDDNGKVFAVFNLSAAPQTVRFQDALFHGDYIEHFGGRSETLDASTSMTLKPWEYRVYLRRSASH
ncbi:MAG: alpha-amlyase [Lysobacter sp.]|nr:MAG: alpha-amlyase [Lysobacter sp.]